MAITDGTNLASVAASQKVALAQNYVDFTDGSTGWEET